MTHSEAWAVVGGLSNPSKMPGSAWGISPRRCHIGMQMRHVEGSVCSICYALKGNYIFPSVHVAHERRYQRLIEALSSDIQRGQYIDAFRVLLSNDRWFRFFDAGDIQGTEHLHLITDICHATPEVRHWMPTREIKYVKTVFQSVDVPANLTPRLSSAMIEGDPPQIIVPGFDGVLPTSGVTKNGFTCPAPQQGGECGMCRACWDPDIPHVTYKKK